MKYPPTVWAGLWIKHGGRTDKVAEAVATVMCESNGDTDATSSEGARGGWQFMPETLPSEACARSADCSTKEAVKLSKKGADFSAWDCHPDSVARSGRGTGDKRYESILADLKGPFGLPDVPFPGPDVDLFGGVSGLDPTDILGGKSAGDLLNIPGEIIAFFQHAGELLFTEAGWIRLGKMLGGVLLILWGLRVLVKQTTGTDPVRVAKKTAEAAAAVAVAK